MRKTKIFRGQLEDIFYSVEYESDNPEKQLREDKELSVEQIKCLKGELPKIKKKKKAKPEQLNWINQL